MDEAFSKWGFVLGACVLLGSIITVIELKHLREQKFKNFKERQEDMQR